MASDRQRVYVISDLHLGGQPGAGTERGFRMCTQGAALAQLVDELTARRDQTRETTELVINGDFVDYLAEELESEPTWTALKPDPAVAERLLDRIVERNQAVFSSLSRFVAAGHTLTVLLGNHDIELALPSVRARLARHLGLRSPFELRFLHDGEAHVIGDALIEHGNRYDRFNVVDHDALRRVCSLHSRRQAVPAGKELPAPPGSQLVAELMNPLKRDYPFIDLLKPESTAAVPLLLALEPGVRSRLAGLAGVALAASRHTYSSAAMPTRDGDIAAVTRGGELGGGFGGGFGGDLAGSTRRDGGFGGLAAGSGWGSDEAALREVLDEALGGPGSGSTSGSRFLAELDDSQAPTDVMRGDIASRGVGFDGALGLFRLLVGRRGSDVSARLPSLLAALRAFCEPRLFALDYEDPKDVYLGAARELAGGGFRYVVFGHTHLARSLPLVAGDREGRAGRYLNSGTWADLMRVPDAVFSDDPRAASAALHALVEAIRDQRLDQVIWQRPTYVQLLVEDGRVREASVEEYRGRRGAGLG